jgi:Big-like domain-containing protein
MGRLIKLGQLLIIGAAIIFISCPLNLEDNLTETIESEVHLATASEYTLSIETPENGIINLSGSITVKDNISQEIIANPYQSHAFLRWEKVSGSGNVVFESIESAETSFFVIGGDAVIKAVFLERPRVRYTTPTGSSVGIDASVLIKFSREMDSSTINENTIILSDSNYEVPVSGVITYEDKTVTFTPEINLESWTKFSIKVSREVTDINGVALSADYVTSSPFETSASTDSKPPIEGTFQIDSGLTWTSSLNVLLTDIFARDLDDGTIAKMYVSNDNRVSWSDAITYNETTSWTLSGADGIKALFMQFEDSSGNQNDQIGIGSGPTYIPQDGYITSTINLDTTAPVFGTVQTSGEDAIAIEVTDDTGTDPTGDMYTASQNVDIYLDASDSGIGTSGTGGAETIQMILSQDISFTQGEWNGSGYDTPVWGNFTNETTPISFTVDPGDGNKTVGVKFRDSLGNESNKTYDFVKLDQTPPSGSMMIENDAVYTKNASVSLNISAVDNGVDTGDIANADMFISNASDFSSGSWESFGTTKAWTINNSTDGEKTVYIKFRDSLGNEMLNVDGETDTIIVDATNPVSSSVQINAGVSETNSATLNLTISAADNSGGSGIDQMVFNFENDFTDAVWVPFSTTGTYTVPGIELPSSGGSMYVYASFKDNAGNIIASSASDSIIYDITPPDGTFTVNGGSAYTNNTSVTINSTFSGVSSMRFSNDNSTWTNWEAYNSSYAFTLASGDTNKTVYGQYADGAGGTGNVSSLTDTIILDTAAPVVVSSYLSGTADDNSTTNQSYVTINSNVSGSPAFMRFKNESGGTWSGWYTYNTIKTSWYLYNYNVDGTKRVYFEYKDAAGNVTGGAHNDTIIIDKIAPVVSYFRIGGTGNPTKTKNITETLYSSVTDANGVYQMNIGNYGDAWNGWETYYSSRSTWALKNPGTDEEKRIYCRYRDKAGNQTSSSLYDAIILDTAPPQNVSILVNEGRTYAYDQSVTLTISADDVPSGSQMRFRYIQGSVYVWTAYENFNISKAITLNDADGTKYIYVQVKDDIGNESGLYDHRDTIVLDRPSINYVTRGTPGGNGKVKVYLNTVNESASENIMYRIYTSTTPTGAKTYRGYIYNSGDEIAPPSEETEYYFHVKIGHYYDSLWHYLGTYYKGSGGADKTGYAVDVIIVYDDGDATDLALANTLKTTLQTDYPSAYSWASGTQPAWSVMVIPDTDISDTYSASNIIYGKPIIITPGLYNSYTSTAKDGWVRNIAAADQGIITMGSGIWLLDRIEVNWSAWGLAGQSPTDVGYGESATMSGTNGRYSKIVNNYYFRYPLVSSYMGSSPATGSSQLFFNNSTDGAGFAVYRSGGANPTGGANYSQVYAGTDYYPLVRQGRFFYWGWSKVPYYYYRGRLVFINVVAHMDGY